ncbi:Ankyrin repeat domain-containing protein [Plasmodiophora brassicae]
MSAAVHVLAGSLPDDVLVHILRFLTLRHLLQLYGWWPALIERLPDVRQAIQNMLSSENPFDAVHRSRLDDRGKRRVIALALRAYDPVAFVTRFQMTPLHFAVHSDWRLMLDVVLDDDDDDHDASLSRFDINAGDVSGSTALHLAVLRDSIAMADVLIRHGANVNAVDCMGQTPLHLAAMRRSSAMTSTLLGAGADKHVKNMQGLSPKYYARWKSHCPRPMARS